MSGLLRRLAIGLAPVLCLAGSAQAATGLTPYAMNFSGYLEQNAVPASGTYEMRFQLLVNGTSVWCEEMTSVSVSGGDFSVALGSSSDPQGPEGYDPTCTTYTSGDLSLDPALVSGVTSATPVTVSVQVYDGSTWETLTPALSVSSSVFALQADTAASATTASQLQGVPVSSTAPTSGQVLQYNSTDLQWEPASGGAGTPASPVNSVQFNNSGSFGGSANLTWDDTNFRLGIGAITPSAQLDVSGFGANANGTLRVYDQSASGVTQEIVKAGASQSTTGLTTWQNNSGTTEASMSPSGGLTANSVTLAQGSGSLALQEATGGSSGITWKLPAANASGYLENDGSGNLSWGSVGGGSVTSVGASSPLASSGGTTPTISLTGGASSGDILYWNGSAWTSGLVSQDATLNGSAQLTVTGIGGKAISGTASAGQSLEFNGTNWIPYTPASGTVTSVIADAPLSSTGGVAPTISLTSGTNSGDILYWNGTAWTDGAISQDVSLSGTGAATVAGIQTIPVSSTAPTGTNNLLFYNGSEWEAASAATAGLATASQITNTFVPLAGTSTTGPMTGALGLNTPGTGDPLAQILAATGGAANKGIVVQGATSQSADLQEWQSSTGSVLASVDASGDLGLSPGTSTVGSLQVNREPAGTPNYGLVNLGADPFDGSTLGYFANSSTSGTFLAINADSGYGGDFANFEIAGASKFKIDNAGNVTISGTLNGNSTTTSPTFDSTNGLVNASNSSLGFNFVGNSTATVSTSSDVAFSAAAGGNTTLESGGTSGSVVVEGVSGQSSDLFEVENNSGTPEFQVSSSGNVTLGSSSSLTIGSLTQGSVLFAGTSGVVSQDNGKLYWSDSAGALGIGTNSPGGGIQVNAPNSATVGAVVRGDYSQSADLQDWDNSSGSVLASVSSSGVFTGNGSGLTNITSASIPWATPGTIGSTTPNTGAFTTLTANNAVTFTGTPPASSSSSVLSVGSTISGGDINGTELSINAPSGFTGQLANFETNGSSMFNVDNAGNVVAANNITADGVLSGSSLQVSSSTQGYGIITTQSSGSGAAKLRLDDERSSGQAWDLSSGSSAAGNFDITNTSTGTPAVTILPSGNVGIGTTSPVAIVAA